MRDGKMESWRVVSDAYYIAYGSAQGKHLRTHLHQVNPTVLLSLAARLRNGILYIIPVFVLNNQGHLDFQIVFSHTGGQNCNLDVHFEDGLLEPG